MKAVANAAIAALLAVGCVPSTEANVDPRGAAGARFVPNAAAKGAPFTTSDGWTVTFDRLALVAQVTAQGQTNGSGGYVVWDGSLNAETWVPALSVGSCAVNVRLEGVFLGSDRTISLERAGVLSAAKIPPDIAALVFTTPDNASSTLAVSTAFGRIAQGPAIVFSAHASHGGQTMTLDLSLAAAFTVTSDPARIVVVTVPQDDVVFAQYEIRPELVFSAGGDDTTLVFEPLAEADRLGNHDGVISADELHAISLLSASAAASGCENASGLLSIDCTTLLDRVADSAQHIIFPMGTSR